ncbi:MAG TPA: hypothetical protein VK988_07195 [Acidimicrobiales bacterium]|nr:hypothetical protein [Acidimicrobiales bacterium]
MTRYIGLAEYLWLAEQVTGVEASLLAKASRIELADSARGPALVSARRGAAAGSTVAGA